MTQVVTATWLHEHLNDKNLVLLDASLDAAVEGNTSENDLTIPAARFFDLKGRFSDHDSSLPNTFPSQQQFERECQKLGINRSSRIVVFDNLGIYSSPRVWWMFKTMGHENVSVLDGGLPEWKAKGFPTEIRVSRSFEPGDFQANFQKGSVKGFPDIVNNIENRTFTIVDARSEGRFNGMEDEPRANLQSGHIPGSINIPFKSVLTDGKYKSTTELKRIFEDKCDSNQLVFSCGSGLTACIILLASDIAFKESRYVYDGSWTEWAERKGLTKDES